MVIEAMIVSGDLRAEGSLERVLVSDAGSWEALVSFIGISALLVSR